MRLLKAKSSTSPKLHNRIARNRWNANHQPWSLASLSIYSSTIRTKRILKIRRAHSSTYQAHLSSSFGGAIPPNVDCCECEWQIYAHEGTILKIHKNNYKRDSRVQINQSRAILNRVKGGMSSFEQSQPVRSASAKANFHSFIHEDNLYLARAARIRRQCRILRQIVSRRSRYCSKNWWP